MNRLMTIFHDIRGAMVSISAVLKLIARGTYGEMDREVADKLQEVSARIKKLIGITEEFMSKALLGNGNEETEGETWDLRQEIMGPVVDEFSEEVKDYQITIDNRLNSFPAPTIPVKGSKFWLKSVFRNLLSNAIKYGGPGCAIMIDLEDRGYSYCLSVSNNGQPIPEERRALLFSRFSRVGNREPKKINGLGLYLSRDIIKRHGGDIWYEAINGGSNFVVALPRN